MSLATLMGRLMSSVTLMPSVTSLPRRHRSCVDVWIWHDCGGEYAVLLLIPEDTGVGEDHGVDDVVCAQIELW